MALHAALHHRTHYRYDRPVQLSPQIIRLRPAPHARTGLLSYSLTVSPRPHFLNWHQDPFSNWQARVMFPERVTHFTVTVDLVADLAVYNPFDFFVEPEAEHYPFAYAAGLQADLAPYLTPLPAGPRLQQLLAELPATGAWILDSLATFNRQLQQRIRYLIRLEPGVQTPEETLALGSGSCRDSAWLLVQILRQLGLAARFVSGYLIQLTPDQPSLDGPSGTDHDFTDLHAWAEVFLPGAGWVGLDPTSGLFAGEGHIPLCATPDPQAAAPISGAVDECEVVFQHDMHVTRMLESARVTKPYTEAQWAAITTLGDQVDAALRAGDVRLTMGGEPTFIALDDMESAEWNTAAVGPTKARLAHDLACRLRERFAPEGLLTFGQGKWYPGESLPRWVYALYWRRDGQAVWRLPPAPPNPAQPPSHTQARQFLTALATRLEVDPDNILDAYEDTAHYLLKERRLPVNVDPGDARLNDPEERARLAAVFAQGLGTPRGFVLPVQHWQAEARWLSERWLLRSGPLLLLPGDSPLGLRLPLESLPWLPAAQAPSLIAADPTALPPLAPSDPRRQPFLQLHGAPPSQPDQQLTAEAHQPTPRREGPHVQGGNVRTALTVESRDGYLNVFLPPVARSEDFLDLVAAIEDVTAETGLPVRIEGYAPPTDPRLECLRITPDPGVIEVNIQPAQSWSELCTITQTLYEEARLARLTTEKFLLDGRAVGTGGGNHIVVGAATPLDSPFLRRPDLLASLLRYWQNHPALSYLFASLFIGPTSQHPRVDEARDSQLYELELALAQLPPAAGEGCPPWLVDRVLRHLLVDLTGNTHRTEFCIDKLYSPDTATGRLGLVELRSFEMPPHARMSLVQQLLLRALIARFWATPYTAPLVRWGTALHDRWLLPHVIWQDFGDVVGELNQAGFAFQQDWFRPHFEFRCPVHGHLNYEGILLELRQALEPWPVLGEEPGAGGTARYVDSSLERLQVHVSGLTGGRHLVLCNGRPLPLHATGTRSDYVAGVRYRAWCPPSCLHPTIAPHTPLVFELYDSWNQRVVAGCSYHVAHPGGRHHETFPVNGYEAESRRLARFTVGGRYLSGEPLPEVPNPDYPWTLDLRQPPG